VASTQISLRQAGLEVRDIEPPVGCTPYVETPAEQQEEDEVQHRCENTSLGICASH
jgi:hypothetical protein